MAYWPILPPLRCGTRMNPPALSKEIFLLNDLEKAKAILENGNYTCVLCKGDTVHTSQHRGVRPLLDLLDTDVSGFSAADKVVMR